MPADNEGRFYWLLDRIVRREGIGDVLANGTYWAAQRIGKGAEEYAHNNIKKHEQLPLKLGMLNPIYFLMYCHRREDQHHPDRRAVPAGAVRHEGGAGGVRQGLGPGPRREVQAVVPGLGAARRALESRTTRPSTMSCEIVDWQEKMHYIDDALGMCAGLSSFPLKPPYHIHNYPAFISAAAGHRDGRGRADADRQAEPHPGPGHQHPTGHAASGREAAGGPLEEAVPRARGEAAGRVLQVQGLEPATASRPGRRCTSWTWTTWPRTCRAGILTDDETASGLDAKEARREAEIKKRTVKTIKIDVDKCNGCRACEVICSAFHATPKYSSNNPARSRIRVIREPLTDIYLPVYAGEYTAAECAGRDKYTIDGKEYDECAFCRASCPSRDAVQGAGLRPAAEVRHVRGRSAARGADVRAVVPDRRPDLRGAGGGSRRKR